MGEIKEEIYTLDIKAFFKILWKEKWIILTVTGLLGLLGAYYAFSKREEFISSGKILPETQSKGSSMGQFAGIASLAGLDIGGMGSSGTDAVRPELYPDVLSSTPFFLELFKLKVRTKDNKEILFKDFYDKSILDGEIDEKQKKMNFPISSKYIAYNLLTENIIKDLRKRITASYDKKTGIISFDVKMPDPVVAALVTRYAMDYLTDYITTYRTEKSRKDLEFIENRLLSAKGKYYANQEKKAQYSDRFQLGTIKIQSADIQRERIDKEYSLTSKMYEGLLQKYEEAKMKLQQDTPVIQILDPPVVPNIRSEPKRVVTTLIATFLGGVIGVIISLVIRRNYKHILIRK